MNDHAIAKAEEVLEWLSCDDETRRLYEAREKAIYDDNTRMEGAKEEGYLRSKIEIVKNMLKEGLNNSLISKLCSLPEDEIEKIKTSLKRNNQ